MRASDDWAKRGRVNHDYASSASYLAMTIWAYAELVHGVN
jgi:hypothetical protein